MKEGLNQVAFVPGSADGEMEFEVKLFQITGDKVSQFDMLQVLP